MAGLSLAAIAGFGGHASAAKFKVLYDFCSQGGDSCTDGTNPTIAGLTSDGAGNFYGITGGGGAFNNGVIFELSQNGKNYTYRVRHDIAACDAQNECPEGIAPGGAMTVDAAGNLYGTMSSTNGSTGGVGLAFELTTAGEYKILRKFCQAESCKDGYLPFSPLTYKGANTGALYDGVSSLYGTTAEGGSNGLGLAYTLTPAGSYNTVLGFPNDYSAGASPWGALGVDNSGIIYSVNRFGRAGDNGLVWNSTGRHDKPRVLHDFCPTETGCKDGRRPDPSDGVVLDAASTTLFGTTRDGGKYDHGIAYRMDTSGKNYKILHAFCDAGSGPCKTGSFPSSGLYPDGMGGVVGTTDTGGIQPNIAGVLYGIDLASGKFNVLHAFCKAPYCPDGNFPLGQVVHYGGSLFGVTAHGGFQDHSAGVIYQYTP